MAPRLHRLAEIRSLALHREVAGRLRLEPALLGPVKQRVERWIQDNVVSSYYARAWKELLEGPADELYEVLEADNERARSLRQASPFLGIIDPRRRWEIWRQAGRAEAS